MAAGATGSFTSSTRLRVFRSRRLIHLAGGSWYLTCKHGAQRRHRHPPVRYVQRWRLRHARACRFEKFHQMRRRRVLANRTAAEEGIRHRLSRSRLLRLPHPPPASVFTVSRIGPRGGRVGASHNKHNRAGHGAGCGDDDTALRTVSVCSLMLNLSRLLPYPYPCAQASKSPATPCGTWKAPPSPGLCPTVTAEGIVGGYVYAVAQGVSSHLLDRVAATEASSLPL